MTNKRKAQIRAARKAFQAHYGVESLKVVTRILRGKKTYQINRETHVPVNSIAAYRANVTRGAYKRFDLV